MKPCIDTWIFLVWAGIGVLAMGLLWYNATQAYFWKRKYLALRNSPILLEIERQVKEKL